MTSLIQLIQASSTKKSTKHTGMASIDHLVFNVINAINATTFIRFLRCKKQKSMHQCFVLLFPGVNVPPLNAITFDSLSVNFSRLDGDFGKKNVNLIQHIRNIRDD